MTLKTLSRQDPLFRSYLEGTFSKGERALPVQSLNVGTESELVTFRILPVREIPQPPFLQKWAQVFRVRNFLYVLFPLYLVLVKNIFDDVVWDPWLAPLSVLAALSISLGAFLMNDYLDHVRGVDRVHPNSGSQAIQKGWVTAAQTKHWAWIYLCLGCLLGLPAVWVFPELLIFLSLPGLVAAMTVLMPRMGLKYRRGAEWVVFLLFGPVLTLSFQIAIGAGFDFEVIWIGILTGLHFTFLLHLKNFESLMVNSQAGFENSVSRLGFEKGKRFLQVWWSLFLVLFCFYQWSFHSGAWFLFYFVTSVFLSLRFWLYLRGLKSPAGSGLQSVVKLGRTLAQLALLIWVLQSLWYFLLMELNSAT